jgi:hypothetical protein
MPNILVLHPGQVDYRRRAAALARAAFRDLDLCLILADDSITERDRDFFDDILVLPPAEEVRESFQILERYCADHAIDAVLSQSESSLLLGSLLAGSLALPGISPPAAHLCANKFRCRGELERAGVRVPRFQIVRDAAQVRAFARDSGFPIVLKGVASALGRLVTLVKSASEIDAAVERVSHGIRASLDIRRLCDFAALADIDLGCDPRREFLVEAYVHGDPVETDGLVVGSRPCSFGVSEQVLSKPPFFYIEGYLLPADRPASDLDAIERASSASLDALGVRETGYSIEMRIAAGVVSVIEVNGRLGWDEGFGDMFERAIGRHPALATLDVALGSALHIERRADVHCALAYASCYEEALVARVPTDAELASLSRTDVHVALATYEGACMHAPPHPDVVPHLAFALVSDPLSSRAAYCRAHETVRRLEFGLQPALLQR